MFRAPEEDIYHEFFKARHITRYLEDYVDQFIHGNDTPRNRIKLGIEVESLQKKDGEWIVETIDRSTKSKDT